MWRNTAILVLVLLMGCTWNARSETSLHQSHLRVHNDIKGSHKAIGEFPAAYEDGNDYDNENVTVLENGTVVVRTMEDKEEEVGSPLESQNGPNSGFWSFRTVNCTKDGKSSEGSSEVESGVAPTPQFTYQCTSDVTVRNQYTFIHLTFMSFCAFVAAGVYICLRRIGRIRMHRALNQFPIQTLPNLHTRPFYVGASFRKIFVVVFSLCTCVYGVYERTEKDIRGCSRQLIRGSSKLQIIRNGCG